MVLHFKDPGGRVINIFFERENWNDIPDERAHYIRISTGDYDGLLQEIDFNCYDYEEDITITDTKKNSQRDLALWTQIVNEANKAGKIPELKDGYYYLDGEKVRTWTPRRQRVLILYYMELYPDLNNSQLAEMLHTSRNTVRSCRKLLQTD